MIKRQQLSSLIKARAAVNSHAVLLQMLGYADQQQHRVHGPARLISPDISKGEHIKWNNKERKVWPSILYTWLFQRSLNLWFPWQLIFILHVIKTLIAKQWMWIPTVDSERMHRAELNRNHIKLAKHDSAKINRSSRSDFCWVLLWLGNVSVHIRWSSATKFLTGWIQQSRSD